MAIDGTTARPAARADMTALPRSVPGGDPYGGDPIPTEPTPGVVSADARQPVDARDPTTTRARTPTTPSRIAGLPQPTTRSATQPEVAGAQPEGGVDPTASATPPGTPATDRPSFLSTVGDELENLGDHFESDKARLVTTGVSLVASSTIPVVGNIIAIARGGLHLLKFLGSVLKGQPDFKQLFQAGIEIGLGMLFAAPMAAAAGVFLGEVGVPAMMGDFGRSRRPEEADASRPPASAGPVTPDDRPPASAEVVPAT